MERALKRVAAIKQGNPLDADTMIGAQASNEQLEKILSYIDIGKQEGAEVLTGGERSRARRAISPAAIYVQPTVFKGHNKMRIFQEEIFGPVVSVTTFKDDDEALAIANDTLYGLGAGVWTRDANRCYRFGRGIQAGRVWTNCYHAYPGPCRVRRLQAVRHRPRDPQDDARPLPADQEPAGQLQPEEARLLLIGGFRLGRHRRRQSGAACVHRLSLAPPSSVCQSLETRRQPRSHTVRCQAKTEARP